MPAAGLRPLRRAERALAYGLLGGSTELVFTAAQNLLHKQTRSPHLQGHSYLWMPPIYGLCAVLYEPLHDRLRTVPTAQRAAVYAAGIIGVEYVTGRLIERVAGVIPWDYTGPHPQRVLCLPEAFRVGGKAAHQRQIARK